MNILPKLSDFTAQVGNTLWNLNGAFQFDFNVKPNSVEEVLQNLYNIWAVPIFSQPLLRSFGNDISWIDQAGDVAQFQLQTAFLIACAKWEPRAIFKKIQFQFNTIRVISGEYVLYTELEIDLTTNINNLILSGPGPVNYWVLNNKLDGSLPYVVKLDLVI